MHFTPFAVCIYYARNRLATRRLSIAGPGQRSAYTLVMVDDGTAICQRTQYKITLRTGEVGLLQPGHTITMTKGSRSSYLCFDLIHRERHYRPSKAGKLVPIVDERIPDQPDLQTLLDLHVPMRVEGSWAQAANHMANEVLARYWRSHFGLNDANARLQTWVCQYLESLHDTAESKPSRPVREVWVTRVRELMRNRLGQGARVEDIADQLGMSRSHFSVRFKKATGRSPGTELEILQMEEARRLLRHAKRRRPLSKIALTVGFSTSSSFARCFRKHHGVSPSKWRQEQLNSMVAAPARPPAGQV